MRLIYDPHIRRDISVLALNATVHGIEKQLPIFFNHGGNTLHIHEEGGGTELRESLGRWLSDNRFNVDTIFCCMIGHDSEDGLQRKDPDSLNEDISLHRELLKAPILHLVYLDPPTDKSAICMLLKRSQKIFIIKVSVIMLSGIGTLMKSGK